MCLVPIFSSPVIFSSLKYQSLFPILRDVSKISKSVITIYIDTSHSSHYALPGNDTVYYAMVYRFKYIYKLAFEVEHLFMSPQYCHKNHYFWQLKNQNLGRKHKNWTKNLISLSTFSALSILNIEFVLIKIHFFFGPTCC